MSKENCIGIDLGTTTSQAVVFYDGKTEQIIFDRTTVGGLIEGPMIDSVFSINPDSKEEEISNLEYLKTYPESYITEVKRCMGKTKEQIKTI